MAQENDLKTVTVTAMDIEWDTDGEQADGLPKTIEVPEKVYEDLYVGNSLDPAAAGDLSDRVSDYITEQTGFCHKGYRLIVHKTHPADKRTDDLKMTAGSIEKDQEHLHQISQASPAFYMIMDICEAGCSIDDADAVYIVDEKSGRQYEAGKDMPDVYLTMAKQILFDGYHGFDPGDADEITSGEDLEEYLMDTCRETARTCSAVWPVRRYEALNRSYLFLTYEEAKRCIEIVPYRFTKHAHPYAMTPDRQCRGYRNLYDSLQMIDFDKSVIVYKDR